MGSHVPRAGQNSRSCFYRPDTLRLTFTLSSAQCLQRVGRKPGLGSQCSWSVDHRRARDSLYWGAGPTLSATRPGGSRVCVEPWIYLPLQLPDLRLWGQGQHVPRWHSPQPPEKSRVWSEAAHIQGVRWEHQCAASGMNVPSVQPHKESMALSPGPPSTAIPSFRLWIPAAVQGLEAEDAGMVPPRATAPCRWGWEGHTVPCAGPGSIQSTAGWSEPQPRIGGVERTRPLAGRRAPAVFLSI